MKAFVAANRELEEVLRQMHQTSGRTPEQAIADRQTLERYPDVGLGKWHFTVVDPRTAPKSWAALDVRYERAQQRLHGALFALVAADKETLGLDAVLSEIKDRQYLGDKDFFDQLGEAVKRGARRDPRKDIDTALVSAALGDMGLRGQAFLRAQERLLPRNRLEGKSLESARKLRKRHRLT